MYYYIYDQFLSDKKFQSQLAKIENRLTDLEIFGKVGRLSLLKNSQDLVETEIKKGATTVVAVGNDQTVSKIINVLANYPEVCLGIVPIGPEQKIARTLGIPEGVEACNILASRIINRIDLGKVKNIFFLSQIEINNPLVNLECDDQYIISPKKNNSVFIYNFNYWSDDHLANPGDGFLETVITPHNKFPLGKIFRSKTPNISQFFNKSIKIKHLQNPVAVKIDGQQIIKTPVLVEIAPNQLKVIVGKKRVFV